MKFANFAGGDIIPTSFSDNFNRANSSALGPNWLQVCWHESGGGGIDASALAQIAGGQCQISNNGPDNPVGGLYNMAWMPVPVFQSLYNKTRTFVQVSWVSGVAALAFLAGISIRFNSELQNGIGVNLADMYYLFFNQLGNVGDLARITGTGSTTLITQATFATTVTSTDVVRLTCVDTGAACILNVLVNGVSIGSVTDSSANRILMGSPGLAWSATAGAGVKSMNFDNFSCGVF